MRYDYLSNDRFSPASHRMSVKAVNIFLGQITHPMTLIIKNLAKCRAERSSFQSSGFRFQTQIRLTEASQPCQESQKYGYSGRLLLLNAFAGSLIR